MGGGGEGVGGGGEWVRDGRGDPGTTSTSLKFDLYFYIRSADFRGLL